MEDLKIAYTLLKENGYKTTAPRRVILEFLTKGANKHLSCDEIHRMISVDHPEVGIATVYRNMQLFEDLKIVTRLTLDDGVARYELSSLGNDSHQHHHLVCLECGKLIELKNDLLGNLEREIEAEQEFKISDHDLKFYGHCKECSEKSK